MKRFIIIITTRKNSINYKSLVDFSLEAKNCRFNNERLYISSKDGFFVVAVVMRLIFVFPL